MKRIIFVTSGFTGSVLPLANELLKQDYAIDLYLVIFRSQNQHEFEALEIMGNQMYGYGVNSIPTNMLHGIEWMVNLHRFRFYLVCNFGNASKGNFIKKWLSKKLQGTILRKIARKIRRTDHIVINTVGHDLQMINLSVYLHNEKLFHTCHEVYIHSDCQKTMLSHIIKLMEYKIPIIVPSRYLRNYILNVSPSYPIVTIPFGKFIGYKAFNSNLNIKELPCKYILFLGNVLPYKGLDNLVNAYKLLKQQDKTIKIVVAGNGHSIVLDEIKNNEDFCIINRWITNDELVTLINKCAAIVCPYLSASQSGLPVTAYVFNKPVIVTNVGAMTEYVLDNTSGYIIPVNNIQLLAEKISNLYINKIFITDNQMKKTEDKLNMGWDNITQKYINLIED